MTRFIATKSIFKLTTPNQSIFNMSKLSFITLDQYKEYPIDEMRHRLALFYEGIRRRRTVREFSDRLVPRGIVETALLAVLAILSESTPIRSLFDVSTAQRPSQHA